VLLPGWRDRVVDRHAAVHAGTETTRRATVVARRARPGYCCRL